MQTVRFKRFTNRRCQFGHSDVTWSMNHFNLMSDHVFAPRPARD